MLCEYSTFHGKEEEVGEEVKVLNQLTIKRDNHLGLSG